MKIVFVGQVPKDISEPDLLEDVYSIDMPRIALCDGASESFDSRTWATLLAKKFASDPYPIVDTTWVNEGAFSYAEQFNPQKLSWSKQAAFQRGSFSTLLGLQYFDTSNTVRVTGIGDTVALLTSTGTVVDSFPYKSADQFKNRPELLATKDELNNFLSTTATPLENWNIGQHEGCHILCMTDALGEWALQDIKDTTSRITELLAISTTFDLKELTISQRNNKSMRTDDVTLMHIAFEDD